MQLEISTKDYPGEYFYKTLEGICSFRKTLIGAEFYHQGTPALSIKGTKILRDDSPIGKFTAAALFFLRWDKFNIEGCSYTIEMTNSKKNSYDVICDCENIGTITYQEASRTAFREFDGWAKITGNAPDHFSAYLVSLYFIEKIIRPSA